MTGELYAWRQVLAPVLIFFFLFTAMWVPTAHGGIISTEAVVEQQRVSEARADIQRFLSEQEVQERLVRWGVDPEMAQERVERMTDAEVMDMAARMDDMPAGGVVTALLIIFLVLLFTDLMGWTDVYPFTR